MGVRPDNIRVHIGDLVLEGLADVDRAVLEAAIQAEMARLVARRPLSTLGDQCHQPNVDAGTVSVDSSGGVNATLLGAQLARAVHGGLGQ